MLVLATTSQNKKAAVTFRGTLSLADLCRVASAGLGYVARACSAPCRSCGSVDIPQRYDAHQAALLYDESGGSTLAHQPPLVDIRFGIRHHRACRHNLAHRLAIAARARSAARYPVQSRCPLPRTVATVAPYRFDSSAAPCSTVSSLLKHTTSVDMISFAFILLTSSFMLPRQADYMRFIKWFFRRDFIRLSGQTAEYMPCRRCPL